MEENMLLKGRYEVQRVNKDWVEGKTDVKHIFERVKFNTNHLTELALACNNGGSVLGQIMGRGADKDTDYGAIYVDSGLTEGTSTTSYNIKSKASDLGINIYGLNYEGSPDIIQPPFMNIDGTINHDMIVFHGGSNTQSYGAKEAVRMEHKHSAQLIGYTNNMVTYSLPEGVGVGHIKTLCISVGQHVEQHNGGIIARAVAKTYVNGTTPCKADLWCMPNVKGLTSPDEILLGYSKASSTAMARLNLVSGAFEWLQDGDPLRNIELGYADGQQCVINNVWYRAYSKLWGRNLDSGVEVSATKSSTSAITSLFAKDDKLYESYYNTTSICERNLTTLAKGATITITGSVLPDGCTKINNIGSIGDNWFVVFEDRKVGFECTDLLNVKDTKVKFYNTYSHVYIPVKNYYYFGTTKITTGMLKVSAFNGLNTDNGFKLISPNSGNLYSIAVGVTDTVGDPVIQKETGTSWILSYTIDSNNR